MHNKLHFEVFNFILGFILTGQVGAGVFLILSGYVGCNQTLVIMMLCFALGINAAIYGGFQVNGVDLSPR